MKKQEFIRVARQITTKAHRDAEALINKSKPDLYIEPKFGVDAFEYQLHAFLDYEGIDEEGILKVEALINGDWYYGIIDNAAKFVSVFLTMLAATNEYHEQGGSYKIDSGVFEKNVKKHGLKKFKHKVKSSTMKKQTAIKALKAAKAGKIKLNASQKKFLVRKAEQEDILEAFEKEIVKKIKSTKGLRNKKRYVQVRYNRNMFFDLTALSDGFEFAVMFNGNRYIKLTKRMPDGSHIKNVVYLFKQIDSFLRGIEDKFEELKKTLVNKDFDAK